MKFSLIFEAQLESARGTRASGAPRCVEQAVYAEAMGFDRVWAVEHHSLKYSHMSAPEIFLTGVAAKTRASGWHAACACRSATTTRSASPSALRCSIISGGRLDVGGRGAARSRRCRSSGSTRKTPSRRWKRRSVHRALLGGDTIHWDSDLLKIQHPPGPASPHGGAPTRPAPPPAAVLACTNPETVRTSTQYGVGRCARLRRTGGDRRHAAHVRRRARRARPRGGRVTWEDQRRVRRALPHVPDGRPRGGAPHRLSRPALLRRGDHATGPPPNGWHRRATPNTSTTPPTWRGSAARARGGCSRRRAAHRGIVDLQPRPALGDADAAIAYVERLQHGRRRQRDVPHPDGHAHPGREAEDDPDLRSSR